MVCSAGSCETAVPVLAASRLIGLLQTGQLFSHKRTSGQFERSATMLTKLGMGVDRGQMKNAYFATRPREAQIGAWASAQSSVLRDRGELEGRVGDVSARFRDAPIPRPPHWGGYRLTPDAVEFWQGRPFRLHDRFLYTRDADEGTGWRMERLSP